jgi:divalent metal cation (Fe/Co/Zn/Cd) transporter
MSIISPRTKTEISHAATMRSMPIGLQRPSAVCDPLGMESSSLPLLQPATTIQRSRLVRRAKLLAWLGLGWHGIEAAVAITAGIVAGSIALVGFGADSLIESVAGVVLLWRFAEARASSESAERSAQRLIGASFYVLAAYITVEAIRTLAGAHHPDVSYVGIGLAAVTLVTMPPLAMAKARVGERLNSSATKSEGRQNMVCAYLSGALLVGLGANAVAGWWWADPLTAIVIAVVAVREGRQAWRGDACCAAC